MFTNRKRNMTSVFHLDLSLTILLIMTMASSTLQETAPCTCAEPHTGSDLAVDDLDLPGENGEGLVVYIAALVPHNTSHIFSLIRSRAAIDLAVLQLQKRGIFTKDTIKVIYKDSACSTTTGPLAAFNLWSLKRVHVFLGPVCDFAVAAVSRFSTVWNIPVVTPGAFAHDFAAKTGEDADFRTLTRMTANFNSLSLALNAILSAHPWQKVKVLYEVMGFPEIMNKFCYLAVSALVYYSKKVTNKPYDFHIFNPDNFDPKEMLEEQVGLDLGGELVL